MYAPALGESNAAEARRLIDLTPLLAVHLSNREIGIVAVVVVLVLWVTSARKPGRRCTRCQELNRDHAQYCAQCGGKLTKK